MDEADLPIIEPRPLRHLWSWARQHGAGVVGQVASGLPIMLLTIVVARASDLESAGRFTVLVAISAAAFSTAMWGLRTTVIVERLRRFTEADYVLARVAATAVAAVFTVLGGMWMQIHASLIVTVLVLRGADATVDLVFAFIQLRRGTSEALRLYACFHLGKLTSVAGALLLAAALAPSSWREGAMGGSVLVAMGAVLAGRAYLNHSPDDGGVADRFGQALRVLSYSRWFAMAVVACALLTSAPRTIIPLFYSDDSLGVIGVSLSSSTILAMVFSTSWIRHLPRFEIVGQRIATVRSLLTEVAGLAIAALLAAWFILPQLVGWIFGFSEPALLDLARAVLSASVIFFTGMNLANLFKVSGAPWMEIVVYMTPLLTAGPALLVSDRLHAIPLALLIAGLTMTTMVTLSLGYIVRSRPR